MSLCVDWPLKASTMARPTPPVPPAIATLTISAAKSKSNGSLMNLIEIEGCDEMFVAERSSIYT
jgi:hypothetical protein